jgi:probable phosphoglycerate mutase
MAGLNREEIEASFPGELSRRAADKYHWQFPEGESYADGDVRAAASLRVVAAAGVARPLVVSHEMIGRMLLRNLLDLAPMEALAYGHPHDVIYRVDVAGKVLHEIRAS